MRNDCTYRDVRYNRLEARVKDSQGLLIDISWSLWRSGNHLCVCGTCCKTEECQGENKAIRGMLKAVEETRLQLKEALINTRQDAYDKRRYRIPRSVIGTTRDLQRSINTLMDRLNSAEENCKDCRRTCVVSTIQKRRCSELEEIAHEANYMSGKTESLIEIFRETNRG